MFEPSVGKLVESTDTVGGVHGPGDDHGSIDEQRPGARLSLPDLDTDPLGQDVDGSLVGHQPGWSTRSTVLIRSTTDPGSRASPPNANRTIATTPANRDMRKPDTLILDYLFLKMQRFFPLPFDGEMCS